MKKTIEPSSVSNTAISLELDGNERTGYPEKKIFQKYIFGINLH